MDQPRNEHGQYVTLREFVMSLMDERFAALRREMARDQQALELQAKEYERRLEDLNHAHARAQTALHTFVSIDKYDDQLEAMEQARKIALERLDEKVLSMTARFEEKLDDYIRKYELRQREIDQALDISKGAAEESQRIAEAQARKTNRNMAILGIIVTIVIAVSNWLGSPTPPIP